MDCTGCLCVEVGHAILN